MQYTVYSPRAGGDEINLGESLAGISIGVMSLSNGSVTIPDPRIMTVTAKLTARDAHWNHYKVQDVELE